MKLNVLQRVLGIYDLIIGCIGIYVGVLMIKSDYGVFIDYPKGWVTNTPFNNWLEIGLLVIAFVGIGNLVGGFTALRKHNLTSVIMSIGLIVCVILQAIMTSGWYLASIEFIIIGIIQLIISVFCIIKTKRIH